MADDEPGLANLSDPSTDALTGATVAAQEEDHFLLRTREQWEADGVWTLRLHVLCGGRRDWSSTAARRDGGAEWIAPWLGPAPDAAMARALLGEGAPPASPGPCAVGSPAGSASDDDEAESCDTIMAESGSSLDDEPRARPPPRTPTRRASGGGASPRPEPPSPATPHTRAMSAPLGPCVRTHDYPSDFLAKWAEAAVSGAVADKLPPHAMPVGAQQVLAALAFVAGLPPRLRQVTAVPAWDGRRIIGYALLHAAPTSALFRRAADADAAEGPRPPPLTLPPTAVAEHGDDSPKTGRAWRSRGGAALVAAAPATPPRGAAPGSSLRRQSVDPLDCVAASLTLALADAGASRAAIDAALPDYAAQLPAELAEAARPAEAGRSERVQASRARRVLARRRAATAAARRAVSPAELALFDAGLRAPLEALVSTLYLASVKDQNPLHAIELLASAACQGRRTLLPWSGEWADPDVVGNGGEDDPCEKLAEEVGLDILEVAAAVHRGREFVEPVLELGLGSAGNTLFRTLSLFGAELVTQCSSAAERVDASSALRAHGGHAAVRKLSKLLAAARGADGRLAGVLPWSPGRGGRHGGPRATPASAAAAARAAAAADDAARDHDGDEDEDDELDDDELPRPDDGRADDDERYADDDDGRYADDRCYAEGRAAADDAACLRDAYVLRRGAGRARVRAADAPPLEAPCPEAPCADDEARCAYDEARDMEHSDGGPGAVPRDDGGEARGHHQRHRQRWRDGASAMPMMDDGEDDDDEEAAAARHDEEAAARAHRHHHLLHGHDDDDFGALRDEEEEDEDDDDSFAALAETLLARALLGRDKYAPKALMRAAALAAEVMRASGLPLPPEPLLAGYAARLASASAQRDVEGVERALARGGAAPPARAAGGGSRRVLPVVLVLAFEESVYVVLEAHYDSLLKLCAPRKASVDGDDEAPRDSGERVVIAGECWTGGGFGHVEVMMQLPQPLRLACDRSLLHHALLALPPPPQQQPPVPGGAAPRAASSSPSSSSTSSGAGPQSKASEASEALPRRDAPVTPWLTLALLPGADDLVAVPLAGLYIRTAASAMGLGDDAGAPPPFAAALLGDGLGAPLGAAAPPARPAAAPDAAAAGGDSTDDDDDDEPHLDDAEGAEEDDDAELPRNVTEARGAYVDAQSRVGDRHVDLQATEGASGSSQAASSGAAPAAAPAAARSCGADDDTGAVLEPAQLALPGYAAALPGYSAAMSARRSAAGAPATPAVLLLSSYFGFRDGLRFNGPPLHGGGGGGTRLPKPRPATELLRALARCPLPQIKLCGRVLSMSSTRSALEDAARLGNGAAHFCAVRCPRKALESPVAGRAARASTYVPHVSTLVATRRKLVVVASEAPLLASPIGAASTKKLFKPAGALAAANAEPRATPSPPSSKKRKPAADSEPPVV